MSWLTNAFDYVCFRTPWRNRKRQMEYLSNFLLFQSTPESSCLSRIFCNPLLESWISSISFIPSSFPKYSFVAITNLKDLLDTAGISFVEKNDEANDSKICIKLMETSLKAINDVVIVVEI
uniref:AlNc14C133G7013 protein n=1 Tax=Albugo laibachii Nc14 TaxID=890382 RepID=F0WKG1_9STRA|nr:AlNc14C133G7013 [Albugo laibachii Nc14]|eukprot:CCA21765.1 AlNc14C133G7013 [Albugo laibachii Nc14]